MTDDNAYCEVFAIALTAYGDVITTEVRTLYHTPTTSNFSTMLDNAIRGTDDEETEAFEIVFVIGIVNWHFADNYNSIPSVAYLDVDCVWPVKSFDNNKD